MCVTSGGANATTTCGVALWFGAHVARTDQWTAYDGTTGASTVSGSPYHVALAAVDGASVGQRDNQMQASAVTGTGILTINKVVTGGPGTYPQTDFSVTVDCTVTTRAEAVPAGIPEERHDRLSDHRVGVRRGHPAPVDLHRDGADATHGANGIHLGHAGDHRQPGHPDR